MSLKELYNSSDFHVSFEIFPPKAEISDGENKIEALFQELKELSVFNPSFISVTYGAGGSTREKTIDLVVKIKNELNITPMPHFTCVGATRTEILHYLKIIQEIGINDILALRGDPPKGETEFKKPENGFGYANELVEFINASTNLGIAVAGYPEGHQECESLEKDIINLKGKVDAGADIIITQLFYDNNFFFDFLEKTQNAGINIPVIPGILPAASLTQLQKITSLCSASLPDKLLSKLKKFENDNEAMKEAGFEYAFEQCRELIENKIPGIHFYTLNKSFMAKRILEELGFNSKFNAKTL